MSIENRFPIVPRMMDFKGDIDRFLEAHPRPTGPITQAYQTQAEQDYSRLEDQLILLDQDRQFANEPIDMQEYGLFMQKIDELRQRIYEIRNEGVVGGRRKKKGGVERMDEWERENAQRLVMRIDEWIEEVNEFLNQYPVPTSPITRQYRQQVEGDALLLVFRANALVLRVENNQLINQNYKDQLREVLTKLENRTQQISEYPTAEGGRRTRRQKRIRKSTGRKSRR